MLVHLYYPVKNNAMETKLDPEKLSKWWKVIKTIIEIVLAALGGAATAAVAQSCGLLDTLSSVL